MARRQSKPRRSPRARTPAAAADAVFAALAHNRFAEAETLARQALKHQPNSGVLQHYLAMSQLGQGQATAAQARLEALWPQRRQPQIALHGLMAAAQAGVILTPWVQRLLEADQPPPALPSQWRQMVDTLLAQLEPASLQALLPDLQAAAGQDREALIALLRITDHHAWHAEGYAITEHLLHRCQDQRPMVWHKSAQLLTRLQRPAEAQTLLEQCLRDDPEDIAARRLLIAALQAQKKIEDSLSHLETLSTQQSEDVVVWLDYAAALNHVGDKPAARTALDQVLALAPDHAKARLMRPFFELLRGAATQAELDATPAAFLAQWQALRDWIEVEPEARKQALTHCFNDYTPFLLAYVDQDITPCVRAYGQLLTEIAAVLPPLDPPPPMPRQDGRIRVLIFSNHVHHQSVWLVLLRGLLTQLDRTRFEVVLCIDNALEDDQTRYAISRVDRVYRTREVPEWREVFAAEQPDVILYAEIGMEPNAIFFASQRLAPLQAVLWGHPVSSGMVTLDLFFSGELLEPDNGQDHYIEKLIKLPGTGACTPLAEVREGDLPPEITALLDPARPLALIPAYPFKIAPDDDAHFARIAQENPGLRLVIFAHPSYPRTHALLEHRMRTALQDQGLEPESVLVVLPLLRADIFNRLLRRADLYLDVPTFSGFTTAWQGAQAGIPIVTLEGRFKRQRLAAGLLRKIGLTDTIAQDKAQYRACVRKLLHQRQHDPQAWQARRERLREAAPLACNDVSVVRAFEQTLIDELAQRGHAQAQSWQGATPAPTPASAAPLPSAAASATAGAVPTAITTVPAPPVQTAPSQTQEFFTMASSLPAGTQIASLTTTETPTASPPPAATLTPAKATTSPPAPAPLYQQLDADLHLGTLSHDYAPVGLLKLIDTPPRKVFDLGCFCGGSGRWIKQQFPDAYVFGVEKLAAAADKARAHYDEVWCGEFEDFDLSAHAGQYDTLIAADVLEHLYNPWKALERLRTLLAPGGTLYISLPNVRNLHVLMGLAEGRWQYQGAGILDITHVRFFTRAQAVEMLQQTGWQAVDVRINPDPKLMPAFEGRDLREVKHIEAGGLKLTNLAHQDVLELLALQFFIKCELKY